MTAGTAFRVDVTEPQGKTERYVTSLSRLHVTVILRRTRFNASDQSSLIVGGPFPAGFSYLPLPTLRYCVKPCLARWPSRRTCAWPATTWGALSTRWSGAPQSGQAA